MNFSVNLSGQNAIVTGAGEGVGKAIALALAAAGANVCVNDINPDRAAKVRDEIVSMGRDSLEWTADASNKFHMASMIEACRDQFGKLHILINAAGVSRPSTFLKLDDYDWRRIIEVNLTGVFYCTQLVGRVMADEGGGVIVNIASVFGHTLSLTQHTAYTASKAGVIGLTREVARELAPLQVRVNAICPAQIADTEGTTAVPSNPQERIGTPEEVAAVALFLVSDGASFITGQAIHVDGGLSMV